MSITLSPPFRSGCCALPEGLDDGLPEAEQGIAIRVGEKILARLLYVGTLRDDLGDLEAHVRWLVGYVYGSGPSAEAVDAAVAVYCRRIRGR